MNYRIGYGRPPEHSRFNKGQSGNPRGRRKRPRDFGEDLMAELAETISVTQGGRVRRITKQRALIKALAADGIKGNARAAQLLISWCAQVIKASDDPKTQPDLSESDRQIVEAYLERQVQQRLAQRTGGK